ncbi:hypothetical protein HYV84_06830 [Candidatus Woesearchaeota archaeon]|nr:hypothetical protein [Candidatus Woesearchaeota archaeon]
MAEYWNSLLTEKSWGILQGIAKIPKEKFSFIVIGGWAAYLWTKLHKSKDVDVALAAIGDLRYLKEHYALKKNDRLKNYEISFEEIDLDIYVPYFSRLPIPVEDLKGLSTKVEGFSVVKPEALLVLKQGAELDRKGSVKGIKDQVDIMTILCRCQVDFRDYHSLLKKYKLEHFYPRLVSIIKNFKEFEYLGLTPGEFKVRKSIVLGMLKFA